MRHQSPLLSPLSPRPGVRGLAGLSGRRAFVLPFCIFLAAVAVVWVIINVAQPTQVFGPFHTVILATQSQPNPEPEDTDLDSNEIDSEFQPVPAPAQAPVSELPSAIPADSSLLLPSLLSQGATVTPTVSVVAPLPKRTQPQRRISSRPKFVTSSRDSHHRMWVPRTKRPKPVPPPPPAPPFEDKRWVHSGCPNHPHCFDPHQECRFSSQYYSPEDRKQSVLDTLRAFMRSEFYDPNEYFLYGGTLLGAKRDGKFITWDEDGDLGVSWTAFQRVLNITKGGDYRFGEGGRWLMNTYCKQPDIPGRIIDTTTGFYVDIFTLFDGSNWEVVTPNLYRQQWLSSSPMSSDDLFNPFPVPRGSMQCKHYSRAVIYPLVPCVFEGISMSCPSRSEAVLESCYGPLWTIPQRH